MADNQTMVAPTGVTQNKSVYYTHDAPQAVQNLHAMWIVATPEQVGHLWQSGLPNAVCVRVWDDDAVSAIRGMVNGLRNPRFIVAEHKLECRIEPLKALLPLGEVKIFGHGELIETHSANTIKSHPLSPTTWGHYSIPPIASHRRKRN
jgi:hypothetical protein